MTPVTTFAGKSVAVFGLGMSGLASCRALAAGGARVVAADDGDGGREAAAEAGFAVEDLAAADWSRFAALVLAPGVPLTHPEPHWTVAKARAAGWRSSATSSCSPVERATSAPDAPFVAVTGTNGKSTTTALIAHILEAAGWDVQMGGNIGTAILALAPPAPDRCHVHRDVLVPDRADADAGADRGHPAQRHARPPRPPRHHGALRRPQGAAGAGRQAPDRRR